ncbi:esterase FrsA [Actinocorallia sp. API 0066]|uniref:alpha/beta fold hydrolase n=1 Tax=Actinocorallia sp. API 0066 TaxID=2896846 RepID=UPI001E5FFE72|nr:alpha/beta hydrolase [Actinocorallia sp. API 0066]MCD0451593.1 esterase FrsA [Actinocorallia sp. API 0066]
MNDLAELKRFAVAHAISQNLPEDHYAGILDAIGRDDGDGPGSWPHEWIRAGRAHAEAGEHLAAAHHYTMGRFPYVDGPGRARALDLALSAFDAWRAGQDIVPVTVPFEGHEIRVWTTGLSVLAPRPLLLMTGGIVSTKEQWGAVLPQIAAFGMAGAVADLPGVGESPLRYHRESWRLFPAILDALAPRARVSESYLLALSFSGHAALQAAAHDPRVRGVVGNGPPISDFFTDASWQARVPAVTTDTLAHLVGVPSHEVYRRVRDWALTPDLLRSVKVPVAVVGARRDEIIPPGDLALLRATLPDLETVEHDDVHGAPSHLAETRLWSLLAVLRMRPDADSDLVRGLTAALDAARAAR